MKYIIIISLIFFSSCESNNPEIETANLKQIEHPFIPIIGKVNGKTFTTGGGLGGHLIEFIDSENYYTFGWCDICAGGGSYGKYYQKSREITMIDTLCFVREPHFTDTPKNVDCEKWKNQKYYIVYKDGFIFLSEVASDTIGGFNENPSHHVYEIEIKETHLIK